MQTTTEKPKTFVKTDTYIIEKLPKEKEKLCSRKSFLLPPNTIKDSHVKNTLKQKQSIFSRSSNVKTNSENGYLRIIKESESYLPLVQNSNTYTNPIICGKSNETSVIQYTSSQTFNMNDQSGINILHSPTNSDHTDEDMVKKEITENLKHEDSLDINIPSNEKSGHKIATNIQDLSSTCIINTKMDTQLQYNIDQNIFRSTNEYPLVTRILPDTEKIDEAHSTNIEEEKCLSTNIHEDLHLSSQVIKTINELCVNSQYNTNDSEYIIVNKREFTNLASKLEFVLCRLEKDMSDLKLTLTTITDTLSAANMTNKMTKIDEIQIKQMTKNLNNNAEAMNNTNTKSSPCAIIDSAICSRDNILKETCETSHTDSFKLPKTDIFKKSNVETPLSCQIDSENKENKMLDSTKYSKSESGTRRRSARLMAKSLNNLDASNDSFVNLENELHNNCIKSNETITHGNYTPVSGKYKNKKVEKPLKEYMSLKSRVSCLLTPKRFNAMNSECDAHSESDGAKVSLSNKILAELNNLYADSPNTQ